MTRRPTHTPRHTPSRPRRPSPRRFSSRSADSDACLTRWDETRPCSSTANTVSGSLRSRRCVVHTSLLEPLRTALSFLASRRTFENEFNSCYLKVVSDLGRKYFDAWTRSITFCAWRSASNRLYLSRLSVVAMMPSIVPLNCSTCARDSGLPRSAVSRCNSPRCPSATSRSSAGQPEDSKRRFVALGEAASRPPEFQQPPEQNPAEPADCDPACKYRRDHRGLRYRGEQYDDFANGEQRDTQPAPLRGSPYLVADSPLTGSQ